jgi:GNAT superfamily N-acetyltransferase
MTPATYAELLEDKIRIIHYSDEMFDDDEEMDDDWKYEARQSIGEQVTCCFHSNDLRWVNNMDIGMLALGRDPDEYWDPFVAGCTVYREYQDPDSNEHVYSFDIAVRKSHQRGTIGWSLVKASIQEARSLECDVIKLYVINPLMYKMLTKMFGFRDEEEPPDARNGFRAHVVLYL